MMDKRQAERYSGTRSILHYAPACTPKRVERWYVNGRVKTWKTRPFEFRLPIKHGLYSYSYIDEYSCDDFHHESDCPFRKDE